MLPSFTYIAYANGTGSGEQIDYLASGLAAALPPDQPGHRRLTEFAEIGGCLYDVHSDGSGWMYSTPAPAPADLPSGLEEQLARRLPAPRSRPVHPGLAGHARHRL